MSKLTSIDITAIRNADDICVHLNARNPDGLVRLIKCRDWNKPFSEDKEHILTARAEICGFGNPDKITSGAIQCFAMCGIYHNQFSGVSAILKTLRTGDDVVFRFYPDAHTNGYVAKAGLHADVMYLDVYRDGKRHKSWELETGICPENSARMCRGAGKSESYDRMAQDAYAA